MKVITTINKFRVCTISKLVGISEEGRLIANDLGVKKGLGVEYTRNGDTYIVVTFIKIKDGQAYIDWVRDTVLEFDEQDLLDWQMVCIEAKAYLDGILEVLEDE